MAFVFSMSEATPMTAASAGGPVAAPAVDRAFKATFDFEAQSVKRREVTVQLRKDHRSSAFAKRRKTAMPGGTAAGSGGGDEKGGGGGGGGAGGAAALWDHESGLDDATRKKRDAALAQQLNHIKTALASPNDAVRQPALLALRKLLESPAAPTGAVCRAGCVPALVKLIESPATLANTPNALAQSMEVVWCLINICATDDIGWTTTVVQSGATVYLTQLLSCASLPLAEQAAWCLGNIASDDREFRRTIAKQGAVLQLVKLLAATAQALYSNPSTTSAAATAASPTKQQVPGSGGAAAVASASSASAPSGYAFPIASPTKASNAQALPISSATGKKLTAGAAVGTTGGSGGTSATAASAAATTIATATAGAAIHPMLSLARVVAWALHNLLKGGGGSGSSNGEGADFVVREATKHGLGSALAAHMTHTTDEALLGDLCEIVCCITQHGDEWVELLLKANVVPFLLHAIRPGGFDSLLIPCIRALAYVVLGRDEFTTHLLSHPHALPSISRVLRTAGEQHHGLQKEVVWLISNIAAGPAPHVEAIIRSGDVSVLAELLLDATIDIQREAAYALRNLSRYGHTIFPTAPAAPPTAAVAAASSAATPAYPMFGVTAAAAKPATTTAAAPVVAATVKVPPYIITLIDEYKILPGIISLLKVSDQDLVHLGLGWVEVVLKLHPRGPKLFEMAHGIDALDTIKDTYYHSDETGSGHGGDRAFERGTELASFAVHIIDRWFGEEQDDVDNDDDGDGHQQLQSQHTSSAFAFGSPTTASGSGSGSGSGSSTAMPPQRPPAPVYGAAVSMGGASTFASASKTASPPQRAPAPTNLTGPAWISTRQKPKH